jgi:dihydrofolate synthase/folylpolyglutamate synthase
MPSTPRTYDETINYLYNLRKHGIKLGLSNIRAMLAILGQPQRRFKSIHIAGTNGKGSTASIVASILMENGLCVGLYTSPHLASFTERIKVNNKKISEAEVIELTTHINGLIKDRDLNPTFFEFVTAMAFYYFAMKRVDWAVVETGMGGRFDATNVIYPEVSIITNVGFDHVEFLGRSISEIAFEKAGIIKQGVPVVTASSNPDAIRRISEVAEGKGSAIHLYNRDFRSELLSMNAEGIRFDYHGYRDYRDLFLPLTGRHQLYNASLALRACEIINNRIEGTAIQRGIRNVQVEGRFEIISSNPLMIIDGAHNPEAVDTLCRTIREVFPDRRCIVIIGILKDKDAKGILRSISRIAETIILTCPRGDRATPPEELNGYLKGSNMKGIITYSVEEALTTARRHWSDDSLILVTGSFYTTGEVKELLGQEAILSDLRE